jgi:SAM-dependent methyltransferase
MGNSDDQQTVTGETMDAVEGLAKIFGGDDVGWIHDGVTGEKLLNERADWYIRLLFDPYPDLKLKPNFRALEIGSGVGYIMQALARYGCSDGVAADRIIGVDIAAPMLEKATARVGRGPPFEFLQYDGVHVPLEDGSLDFIYSVATLQHIPKEYVFNLFFEIKRLLSPTGFSLFQVLGFDHISVHHRPGGSPPWEQMVRNQIKSDGRSQWMYFYSESELVQVLDAGMGFADVRVARVAGTSFSVAISNAPRQSARQETQAQELEASQEVSRQRLGAEVDALQQRNAALESALNSLRDSTTWKLVSPLWRLEKRGARKARRRNTSSSSGPSSY